MRLFKALEISASGLTAERLRLDVIANNLANANTTRTEAGGPYRRQVPVFAAREAESFGTVLARYGDANVSGEPAGQGVRVVEIAQDLSPFKVKYDPSHPDANTEGYVSLPNVNVVSEMVDMISATRAYEANAQAVNAAKSMAVRALEMGRG